MDMNDINHDNVVVLVKLGIDVKDLINIYYNITSKGHDIDKNVYIKNLTEMLKFFQTRNATLKEDDEVILKEDVLEMIQKNKKLVTLDLEKKIKYMCEKLDGYYFMNPNYTNKLIKKNPKIFSVNQIDLEVFAAVTSEFAIKIDNNITNLFEYVIKHRSELLNESVEKVFRRIMYFKNTRNSKLITNEDIDAMIKIEFEVNEDGIKEKYILPKYNLEDVNIYKEKILEIVNQSI